MPTSRPRPTPPDLGSTGSEEHEWLLDTLADLAGALGRPGPAVLVRVSRAIEPATAGDRGLLRPIELGPDDPVAAVVGMSLPAGVDAVAFAADAATRSAADERPGDRGRLIHLVATSGLSVTLLPGPDGRRIGPTTDVQAGRVPEVCRRLLGLGTAPPPDAGIATVTHLWLGKVARLAAVEPGLGWGAVLAAHPFVEFLEDAVDDRSDDPWGDDDLPSFATVVHDAASGLTPATVVSWSSRCAEQWSWSRLRRRVAADHPALIGHALTGPQSAWMDDGMFARWTMGELPPPAAALEVIGATLHPGALVRLHATLALSGLATAPR
jgi:hypothetical protein